MEGGGRERESESGECLLRIFFCRGGLGDAGQLPGTARDFLEILLSVPFKQVRGHWGRGGGERKDTI